MTTRDGSPEGVRSDALDVSVIICAYTLERWSHLRAAVRSVQHQSALPLQTIVVIDGDDELERRARAEIEGVVVVRNAHARGLSGARQTGAEQASGAILAFLDDDAVADGAWLRWMLAPYSDPLVLGVGGRIEADWETGRPRWFPPEFDWVVGCSYVGLPEATARIRNPIGASMSVRASVLARAGAFDPRLGRAPGARAVSGAAEETEFGIRAARAHPGGYWIYEPRAVVTHAVPQRRATWRYFARRCLVEGSAKALLASIAGSSDGLSAERAYVRAVLPRGLFREIGRGLRGDAAGLGAALAIVAGAALTAASYGWTRLRGVPADGAR